MINTVYKETAICPMCGDEVRSEEVDRFSMCIDCFADSVQNNVCETVLYEFLREYGGEFRQFIDENYWEG